VVLVSGDGGLIYRLMGVPNDIDRIVGNHNHTVRSMRIILYRNRSKTEQEGVLGDRRIRDRFGM
jgi:predicted RNA-binding protein YlqC (UPF0109 family)